MDRLSEVAKFVDDVAAATKWYAAILGRQPSDEVDGMSEFHLDGTILRLHKKYVPGEGELPPENHIAFTVANLDQRCEQLRQEGLGVEVPPRDFPWGRSAYLRDRDGEVVELHEV